MKTTKTGSNEKAGLSIKVTAIGPSAETLSSVARRVAASAKVQKILRGTKHRLLHVRIQDSGDDKKGREKPVKRFRATFYDYSNNRVLHADGELSRPENVTIAELGYQPIPTAEEFSAALAVVRQAREFSKLLSDERTFLYPAMPPVVPSKLPDGRSERVVSVGIYPRSGAGPHEIVGVNLSNAQIVRFDRNAPPGALAQASVCGVPGAFQPTAQHVAGQVQVTVTQNNSVLWRFQVVRPAASSGTNGSGVELRYVDYKGKRVLYRAHVPILNVKYDRDACGPYRDWQNEEGMIQANGTDVAPGFRLCTDPAQTILESGSDTGNFLGTAIYVQGHEVVLVSEMQAGWYRYVSMWRLHADGTIRPRFGFSAVSSSCVCNIHHHHCYWRFDFDIRTASDNRVREFNDPPLIGSSNWHTKLFEISRPRDPSRKRKWRVENAKTGEGFEIIPGLSDGVATASPDWPFGRGDVWVLRYHSNEIDDGVVSIGPPYEAGISNWLTGESVLNQDVVIWYGAHFTHDVQHEPPGQHGHVVGPDLKPVNW